MKSFVVQIFWFITIVVVIGVAWSFIGPALLPDADPDAIGRAMAMPAAMMALVVTVVGSRMGWLPGTKRTKQ